MPKVGKREFSYTKAGVKEAKAYAKKTGKKLKTPKARGRGSRGNRI
jgi:hypothetical protein